MSPDSAAVVELTRSPTASACEPFFDFIELSLSQGRNAKAIYQDLVDDYGFTARYQSVKRFVRQLRGPISPQACAVIVTKPGEESQVDYGSGPMVRDPRTGKYRRTRLFVLTLGYSRKAVHLLTFQSSTRIWRKRLSTASGARRESSCRIMCPGTKRVQPKFYSLQLFGDDSVKLVAPIRPIFRDRESRYRKLRISSHN